jgi:predicted  nucleic acid-binding Zn-ribbon protein
MESLTSGTFVGAGSFRCTHCDYTLRLDGSEALSACPSCGGKEFVRASLFSTERIPADSRRSDPGDEATLLVPPPPDRGAHLAKARKLIEQPGEYLYYEENGEPRTVALTREWTRVGRSLAADVRFDDPTVSRRHALIVRHPDGVRLLDDRSLNGVFVNGARVDGRALQDRLAFVSVPPDPRAADADAEQTSLHPIS